MVSKKLELAGYDPRGLQGMGWPTPPLRSGPHIAGPYGLYGDGRNPPTDRPPRVERKRQPRQTWQDVFSLIDATGVCIMFSIRNLLRQDLDILPLRHPGIPERRHRCRVHTGRAYTAASGILNAERLFMARRDSTDATTRSPSGCSGNSGRRPTKDRVVMHRTDARMIL